MYQYHTLNMIAIFLILLLCSKPILSKLFVDPNFASKDISCCKTKSSLSKSQQYISFHPQSLKFTDIPTLTIRENRFEIWNDCDCNNLVIEHIFSRKNDITIASKKDGVILTKDRKKVSIKVLYHPRYPESVDDIIEVQTSRGNFTYSIRASSLQNIFNVEPVEITGDIFRLQVFNPSNTSSLVVQRLFTENEFLFLRPPVQPDSFDSGEDQRLHKWLKSFNTAADASQVWTVPTLQRRDVAEISARSSTPGPQEGYVCFLFIYSLLFTF